MPDSPELDQAIKETLEDLRTLLEDARDRLPISSHKIGAFLGHLLAVQVYAIKPILELQVEATQDTRAKLTEFAQASFDLLQALVTKVTQE